ncbi:MAG: SDR family NAD(P)-dependent oxidoreductase [Firmicutes bacterium]|nr:SDR family NAD(P)-dependent oxidoreductase [Bacillota bacterium]
MPEIKPKDTGDFSSYSISCDNENTIEELFNQVTEKFDQPLAGFIHIASKENSKDNDIFSKRERNILKTIFLCAKYFVRTRQKENSFLVSAVRMDGNLGLETSSNIIQGGLFGLHKSLAIESEGSFLSKAIDLAIELPPDKAADYLIEEIFDTGYEKQEVGRTIDGKRNTPTLIERYVNTDVRDTALTQNDVLLVTGGGRGITANCIINLAKECGCGFVLLGRTSLNQDVSWAEGIRDKVTLRKMAMDRLRKNNPKSVPKPSEIDKMVNSVLHHADIMDTINAIKSAGGRVLYEACDVRDTKLLKQVIEKSEQELGSITGLIHGAGNIEDKKIQRKTVDDFDNVFGSKIEGLETCLNCLDTGKLKYLVLFSSIAGYFGNAGQSDYAMANEVMNKFAYWLKRKQPFCKTVSINWGLWDGGSMVSDSIRSAIKDTELRLIPLEVGSEYFVEQFLYEKDSTSCQIIINCSNQLIRPKIDIPGMQALSSHKK